MSQREYSKNPDKNLEREIERLRGELSAATLAISYLFSIFRILDGITNSQELPRIVAKFMEGGVSTETLHAMARDGVEPDDFIEGANRFKVRLSGHLEKHLSRYPLDRG